jgi:hypothetical protein
VGLAKGSGRVGYLLTAHNHNPAIECIRDCYFPIRNVVVIATPPILFRYSAGPSMAGNSTFWSVTLLSDRDSPSMMSATSCSV